MTLTPGTKKLLTYGIPIAIALVGLFFVARSKKTAATATSVTPASGVVGVTAAGEVQASQNELATYESYTEQEIAGLKTALEGMTAGPVPTTPVAAAPPPSAAPQPVVAQPAEPAAPETSVTGYAGSGVSYSNAGNQYGYQGVHTGTAAGAAERSGLTLYYSPAPGVFTADTAQSDLKPTTGLYLKKTPTAKAAA